MTLDFCKFKRTVCENATKDLKTKVKHALHLSRLRSEPYLPAETRREIEDILSKALGEDKV